MSYILSKNGKLNKVNIMIEKQIGLHYSVLNVNIVHLVCKFFSEKFENSKKYEKF